MAVTSVTFVRRCTDVQCDRCGGWCPFEGMAQTFEGCACDKMTLWWRELHFDGLRRITASDPNADGAAGGEHMGKSRGGPIEPEEEELTWEQAAEESAAGAQNYLKLTPGTTKVELLAPPKRRFNERFDRPEHLYRVRVLALPGGKTPPQEEQVLSAPADGPLSAQLAGFGKAGVTVVEIVRAGTGQTDTRYTVMRAA